MSYKSLLVNRGTIQRNTKSNVDGVITSSWADLATDVRCSLQEDRGVVRSLVGGQGLDADAILFLLPGTDVKPKTQNDDKDRFILTKPATNAKFLVEFVGDSTGRGHHLFAALKRVPAKD